MWTNIVFGLLCVLIVVFTIGERYIAKLQKRGIREGKVYRRTAAVSGATLLLVPMVYILLMIILVFK